MTDIPTQYLCCKHGEGDKAGRLNAVALNTVIARDDRASPIGDYP
jgi:hypothetical protein